MEKEECSSLLWYNHNVSNVLVEKIVLGTLDVSRKYNSPQVLARPIIKTRKKNHFEIKIMR